VLGSILLCVMGVLVTSCDDFSRFEGRSAAYYAGLASECDSLLARGTVIGGPAERELAGQTNSLPPAIRQLGPHRIRIIEETVLLTVGSFFIIWRHSEDDEQLWVLAAYKEGHRKTLYTMSKPQDFVQGSIRISPPIQKDTNVQFLPFGDGGTTPGRFTDAKGREFKFYIDHRYQTKTPGAIYLNAHPNTPGSVLVTNEAEFRQRLRF
jgi:hypothetical protein